MALGAETVATIAIQVAISAALTLVTALLTPKQKIQGPRLKDKRVTTSAYGEPISVNFGTNRVFGNIIWGTDFEEVATSRSLGKGGLFSAGTETTYTYFSNLSIAFGEGEAFGIVKLYADGQLIYDAEDETGEGGRMEGLKFRFYPGSETQEPDPLIVEDVDGREGAGSTPAFRGICHLVLERFPLKEFGNRVPVFEAVIAWKGEAATRIGVEPETVGLEVNRSRTVIDRRRNVVYTIDRVAAPPVLRVHSLASGALLASRALADLLAEADPLDASGWQAASSLVQMMAGAEGNFLFVSAFGNSVPVLMVDKETLSGAQVFGQLGVSYNTSETGVAGLGIQMSAIEITGTLGIGASFLIGGGFRLASRPLFLLVKTPFGALELSFGDEWEIGTGHIVCGIGVTPDIQGGRTIYIAIRDGATSELDTGTLSIYALDIVWASTADPVETAGRPTGEPRLVYEQTTGAEGYGRVAMAWDEAAGGLLISDPGHGTGLLDVETGAFVWFLDEVDGQTPFADGAGVIVSDGSEWPIVTAAETFGFVDPATGETIPGKSFNWSDTFTSGDYSVVAPVTGPVWDPVKQRAYIVDNQLGGFATLYGERVTGAADTLQAVVSAIATRGVLGAADIDVTALSGAVSGYKIERQSSLREMLAPLGVAFNFDAAETGGKILFRHRDGVADVTMAEDDLVPDENGIEITELRGQEIEAPLAVSIEYIAPGRDYQVGTQIVRRIQNPVAVVGSNSESVVELPLALTDAQAVAAAERLLFQAWIERERYAFTASAQFLEIVPNDVIEITADGQTRTVRAQRVGVGGGDRAIEIDAVASEPFVYETASVGVSAALPIQQAVPGQFAVLTPHVLDIPLLRDQDSAGATAKIYVGASREVASVATFRGAAISTSIAVGEVEDRVFLPREATYFTTVTALADAPDDEFFSIHETSFTVRLIRGAAPSSVTAAELIGEDANTLAVFNPTTVGWELIGAGTVTDDGGGLYTFGQIFRSKRGSETHAFGHRPGQRVVLLSAATIDAYTVATNALNAPAKVIAAAPGQLIENAGSAALIHRLESLKPYAPVQVSATLDGSDIDLAWVRRTRIGGAWTDGTGTVPLGEEAEAYAVEIYASPGGALLRTLEAASPAATYAAADIAADFGSTPSALTLRVYQVSAAVGRGFAFEKTIEVT